MSWVLLYIGFNQNQNLNTQKPDPKTRPKTKYNFFYVDMSG